MDATPAFSPGIPSGYSDPITLRCGRLRPPTAIRNTYVKVRQVRLVADKPQPDGPVTSRKPTVPGLSGSAKQRIDSAMRVGVISDHYYLR